MSETQPRQEDGTAATCLPPGTKVGDVVEAFVPCQRCRRGDECPHVECEYACVHAADAEWMVLTVARPGIDGRYELVQRSVPGRARNVELVRLNASGVSGLLARLFVRPAGEEDGTPAALMRGYRGLPYDADEVHATDMAVLLQAYLRLLTPPEVFVLLEHSVRTCGDGDRSEDLSGPLDWSLAFDWKRDAFDDTMDGDKEVFLARVAIVDRLSVCTSAELLTWTNDALQRMDMDDDRLAASAVALTAMVWSLLSERKHAPLDAAATAQARELLLSAFRIDAAWNRPPFFWLTDVEPLPGMDEVAYVDLVRDAFVRGSSFKEWRAAYAYALQAQMQPEALERLGMSAEAVDRTWLPLWEQAWDLNTLDGTLPNCLHPRSLEAAKKYVYGRLVGYDIPQLVPLLNSTGPFWSLLGEAERYDAITTLSHRALKPGFAQELLIKGSRLPAALDALLAEAVRCAT